MDLNSPKTLILAAAVVLILGFLGYYFFLSGPSAELKRIANENLAGLTHKICPEDSDLDNLRYSRSSGGWFALTADVVKDGQIVGVLTGKCRLLKNANNSTFQWMDGRYRAVEGEVPGQDLVTAP